MKALFSVDGKTIMADLSKPINISIPIRATKDNVTAWQQGQPLVVPISHGNWTGSVALGASVNCNDIYFNPHSHGTHTECIGHITEAFHSVNQLLKNTFFMATLISVKPENQGVDKVITKEQLQKKLKKRKTEALIVRSLPNSKEKLTHCYSNTNPPYFLKEAAIFIRKQGVDHLLTDLPSLDKENDQGKLLAHKAFWNYHGKRRLYATITELIYVDDKIKDGDYILNLQIAAFENDASPSKPVLYEIKYLPDENGS